MAAANRNQQAIRLLPWATAWRRAGLFVAQLAVVAGLSWVFVVTTVEVAVLAAGISG